MTIPIQRAKQRRLEGDGVWIDVRTPAEFDVCSISGSINIPLGDLGTSRGELEAHAGRGDFVLVCRTGARAAKAKALLAKQGFCDVLVLEGGLEAWRACDGDVVIGAAKGVMSIARQVRILAGGLALLGAVLAVFVHPAFVWLSGFIGAGLVFSGVTDTCAMGMVLAKMPWNRRKGVDVRTASAS